MRAPVLPRITVVPILALLVAAGSPSESVAGGDPPDLAAYEAARASVGRDPEAHVRLALWCEQHGLSAERVKHLALAVLIDPKNATARGLMGLIEFGGKWRRPDAVGEAVKSDEALNAALAGYNARRARTPDTADAQWRLAVWCEENGLRPEAVAHFTAVTRLEPGREAAWKRLGYKKSGGRWVTDAQLAAEKADADSQKKADRHWKPLLAKWRDWLGERQHRDKAEQDLRDVTDPRAVPSVWAVFGRGNEPDQARAVELLGQIDAPAASRALAALAVSGRSAEVRRAATETLERRDGRDFLGILIGLVGDPLKYTARPVGGLTSPGELLVEGPRYNVRRVYGVAQNTLPAFQLPQRLFDPSVPFDPFSAQNVALAYSPTSVPVVAQPGKGSRGGGVVGSAINVQAVAAQRDLQIAATVVRNQQILAFSQQQLTNDVNAVETYNAGVRQTNERVLPTLKTLTGQELGESSDAWQAWWTDQRGYAYRSPLPQEKPTLTEFVVNPYAPVAHHACFAAGTPVRTLDGPRPIERVRVGDRVLTQNPTSGELSYQPVVTVFHNPPNRTLRVAVGGETIVATGIHRFWKAGHGWAMARDLKPGDQLRTLGGTARVESVTDDSVQPVFNLEVGAGQSFFVGTLGTLVHDNSLVNPVAAPFDAPADVAVADRRAD